MRACISRRAAGVALLSPISTVTRLRRPVNAVLLSDSVVVRNAVGIATVNGGQLISYATTRSTTISGVHLENNVIGLLVDGTGEASNGARVIIRDSVVSGNAADGIQAHSASGKAPAFVLIEHTTLVNNTGIGIHADSPRATMLPKDNTITGNATGISATNGGQLISYGNNTNNNNVGPEGAPTGFFSQM